jgi:uncharacterized repeat protein (TIGR01451 family)
MVRPIRCLATTAQGRSNRVAGTMAILVLWCLGAANMLPAQAPPVHYLHHGVMPPGAIGSRQLQRGGPLPGFFQPVEIKVPRGALVSLAVDSQFEEGTPGPRKTGLLIGSVYRLRVTNIRLAEGVEAFPTIELIDRLFTPVDQQRRFAIPIEITEEDLKLAIDGKFVTRVIYLEDPRRALPTRSDPKSQNWFDTAPGQDPLAIADGLGRPVAILRLGARVPNQDPGFFFGSPPFGMSSEIMDASVCPANMVEGAPMPYSPRGPWSPPGLRQPWPEDEYVRDGGDERLPTCVSKHGDVSGLEMEDAVAHYNTLDGRTLIEPSNEVYLYCPRFGAVRQVVGLLANEERLRPGGVDMGEKLSAPTTTQQVANAKQHVQLDNKIGARPPVAMRSKQSRDVFSTVIGPRSFQGSFQAYENLAIIRKGAFEGVEMPLLARGSNAAIAWTNTQAVQILLDRQGAKAEVKYDRTNCIYTIDSPPGRPKLRLVKVASTPFAEPGDEIDFTLRFDNVGNQPIGNVTILDSLNTRLEYVEGSAQCSVEAKFSTSANEGGSVVVRCEVVNALEPGQCGILRFRCRVR